MNKVHGRQRWRKVLLLLLLLLVQASKANVKQCKAASGGQSAAQRKKPPPDSQGQLDRRLRAHPYPIELLFPFPAIGSVDSVQNWNAATCRRGSTMQKNVKNTKNPKNICATQKICQTHRWESVINGRARQTNRQTDRQTDRPTDRHPASQLANQPASWMALRRQCLSFLVGERTKDAACGKKKQRNRLASQHSANKQAAAHFKFPQYGTNKRRHNTTTTNDNNNNTFVFVFEIISD
ncbi:hypothetical protein T11_1848 [Trichinella zimbabwensis]|uniref:Secreted protein n=1 Tax=Trichinella zimbabwensis TaxID=268475 RepID=A0A0V1HQG0_9BILA|nr:hypothetical protein T11_1848 [Trichinella zimbabwensis]